MLNRITRRLKGDRKYFSIVFFILFLVLIVGIITPVVIDIKENNWNEELDEEVKEIETSASRIFDNKESELLSLKTELKKELNIVLSPPNTSYRELIKLINREKYSGYSVEVLAPNGRIIAWNETIAIPQEKIFPLTFPLGQTYFYNTELIIYLSVTDTVSIENDNFYLVLSKPIEKNYALQNHYYVPVSLTDELNENFYTQFEISYHPFSEKSKDGRKHSFELLNNLNNKIGIVNFNKPSLTSEINSIRERADDIQILLVVIASFIIALGFRKDFYDLKYRAAKAFALIIYLTLLRTLLYIIDFPSRFLEGPFTDPAYFSSAFAGGAVKSPAEFFISVLFFFIIAVYIFRNILHYLNEEHQRKNLLLSILTILSLTIIYFLSIRAVAATIKSVIFDSAIRYFKEPDLIPDLPSLSMNLNVLIFGVSSILLLSGFILLIHLFYTAIINSNKRKNFFVLFITFEILGLIFLVIQRQPLITPLLIFLLTGLNFLLAYHFYYKRANVYNYIYATLAASVICILFMNHFNLKLERNSLKTVSYEINRPNDNLIRFYIEETLNGASKDENIVSSFSKRGVNYDAIAFLIWSNSSLQKESLHSSVSVYNRHKELTGSFSVGIDNPELTPGDFEKFDTGTLKIFQPIDLKNDYELVLTGLIPVKEREIIIGYISATVVYDLKLIGGKYFPDFIKSGTDVLSPVVDIRELKIFEFSNSKVNRFYGDIYPSRDQVEPILNAVFSRDNDAWMNIMLNEEEYLTYLTRTITGDEEKVSAVLLREKEFTWNLFNFFKLFVIHSLFILFLFLTIFLLRLKKINYTFRGQLLIAFLVISIIPVVVLAVYNREAVNERTNTAVINELSERLNYLENHILVQKEKHPGRDLKTILTNAGRELGISFEAYETTEQVFNSREQFYKTGFFSTKLNPDAYYHLNYLSYREYLVKVNIEKYEYGSFYKKILVENKNIIIGVNDAFNKVDIIYSTMDLDVFLFGIYSLAVLIIIIVSTILANRISAPIRKLTKATISVAQGDLNVKLTNSEKGEIKDLVDGFNSMTKELQKNQFELAELERENAWKEMAKQVAHEIKNPLTPLKLAVQQLITSYKDKSDKFDSVFEKVTNTILNQIENLNSIATEFSRFAKMPTIKLEEIDLKSEIEEAVNLFVDEKIKIVFNSEVDTAAAEADSNQFRRMVINLVRNSIQAEATEIKITLNLRENIYILFFSDNGKGISPSDRDKIFNAGFTSKEKGMGIGLKLAKRFLEGINGNIILLETSDKGTTFQITIPALNK